MPFGFEKMHANGDDFVVVDRRGHADIIDRHIVMQLGDRNRGIGFNQLAVIDDCDDVAARLTFWNPDGTSLDACGSATRGVAWKLMQEAGSRSLVLRTNRGLLKCSKDVDGLISVDMGVPLVEWWEIPTARDVDTLDLPLPGRPAACSMGNPHCTVFVDDLDAVQVEAIGPEIENHPLFPQKTNVHFVQIVSRQHIRLRIWERGGGIPLGSGSCSCGAAINGIRRGVLDTSVRVECDGGSVVVRWDGIGGAFLEGPVERSFSGVWHDRLSRSS